MKAGQIFTVKGGKKYQVRKSSLKNDCVWCCFTCRKKCELVNNDKYNSADFPECYNNMIFKELNGK